MIIVIDGYNLLRQVFPGASRLTDRQRQRFIAELGAYRQLRSNEIVLVFDSGPTHHATREIARGVIIIFSGQKRSADEWIIDFMQRNKGKELLLVSGDRKLIEACAEFDVDSIDVASFYQLLQGALAQSPEFIAEQEEGEWVHKYEHDEPLFGDQFLDEKTRRELDLLMMQADIRRHPKIDEEGARPRKRVSKKPSRQEKRMIKKIKKL